MLCRVCPDRFLARWRPAHEEGCICVASAGLAVLKCVVSPVGDVTDQPTLPWSVGEVSLVLVTWWNPRMFPDGFHILLLAAAVYYTVLVPALLVILDVI
ncbi:hypothetical protein NDU88_007541 [Pleurodeles waltl]|uniref:Uncharacterized protein n=1 Tax=Pleurodeles waltl TaxID=8319 RepID=A0AAV7LT69_PLEWA|nr:hypothetical protein NDU88_007541 [Pleurodeles waltl]